MRSRVVVFVLVGACVLGVAQGAWAADPWRDPTQPPAQRASELLVAMSFDQKVQLALNNFAAVASFGVPALANFDGPSGVRTTGTTSFPSSQTLAASFDRGLAYDYGYAISDEARGKGFNWWLGPAMDIARTPLAGRQPENLGEDPFLAGETVTQEVLAAKARHMIATLKHYVANNQEWERIGFRLPPTGATRSPGINVLAAERTLQEIYEAPFKHAIRKANADAVMCSYNRLNGPLTCESPGLLGDLKASGFNGFVVPDFIFAVKDPLAATLAGVDVPGLPPGAAGRTAAMFTSGQVPSSRLDDIVRRILYAMFDSGIFDDPVGPANADVSTPAHRDVATRVSTSGMVLLKNEHRALPLSERAPRSIAVIGPSGDDAMYVTGGSAAVPPEAGKAVTPLAGITARAGSGVQIQASQGSLGDVPLPDIVPATALGGGLAASYWNNGEFDGPPALTRVEPTVDLSAAPTGIGPNLWSARWTGTLTPPESGLYRFSLLEAGIARLYINGQQVASGYREGINFVAGPRYPIQAAVQLTAGQPVSVRIEYTSKAQLFGPQIHFAWQPPSKSLIPAAVDAARGADAAIVIVNNAQGEGMDRSTLALPGDQDALINAVAAVNRRTIVVLNTGGPVLMPWRNRVEGVLEAWYPGQQFGTALASVLFGDSDPGGRLPVTFPASNEQGPAPPSQPERYPGVNDEVHYDEGLLVGYRWYDATGQRPLFPFGYGQSYAHFVFRDLHVRAQGGALVASVRIANVSNRSGSVVPELYVHYPHSAGEPPWQLKGYDKVALAPHESRRVSLTLDPADLTIYDGGPVIPQGRYRLALASSSRGFAKVASFDVRGSGIAGRGHGGRDRGDDD
ncbi:MAG TPA: glycoside hydrolase family 3 C-terminal domain-containing protein [Thermoleophilaceae bacterium]|jgi:beta-glucosidase|nr:glycoside hydrolase family 3 C-terminal domain-containing protein [Thermoleophilaceae bacterium]